MFSVDAIALLASKQSSLCKPRECSWLTSQCCFTLRLNLLQWLHGASVLGDMYTGTKGKNNNNSQDSKLFLFFLVSRSRLCGSLVPQRFRSRDCSLSENVKNKRSSQVWTTWFFKMLRKNQNGMDISIILAVFFNPVVSFLFFFPILLCRRVHLFSIVAVTNHHKFRGLQGHRFVMLLPKVRSDTLGCNQNIGKAVFLRKALGRDLFPRLLQLLRPPESLGVLTPFSTFTGSNSEF